MAILQHRQDSDPYQPRLRRPLEPGPSPEPVDWKAWLRSVEAKRRVAGRPSDGGGAGAGTLRRSSLGSITRSSFQMDGITLTDREVAQAMSRGAVTRRLRTGQSQRLRNHAAILLRIRSLVRAGRPLTAGMVVRWYASIACGLSTESPDGSAWSRLEQVVARINSPPLPLRPAVEEVARLYYELLCDPILPGFNGILARLLLTCHLGRCGLPPAVFDPATDRPTPISGDRLLRQLLERIEQSFDGENGSAPATNASSHA